MNRKTKASLFLMIICVQYLFIGFNVVYVNSSSRNELEPLETDLSTKRSTSHSSPYYFPTNQSTPLMTEVSSETNEEDSLNQASYYYYDSGYVLTLNLDKYVLTPGETITVNLALSQNLTASEGEYISIDIYDEFYRDFRWYDPNYDDAIVPTYTTNVITDGNGQASFSFSSTSQTGIYTVYAYFEEIRVYKEFSVGNNGIFCKGPIYFKPDHTYTAAVHVVNISDFRGVPFSSFNYSISYYVYSDWFVLTTDQVQTDDMGYSIFNVEIPTEMKNYYVLKLTLRTSDGEAEYETYLYRSWDYYYYSLWGGQQQTNQEKIQYIVTSDKTIYTPGESIHLRALVLEYSFMNESKQTLKNTPISLIIYNPDDLAIFWSTLITDEHGIITYTLPLDEDCELGYYGFEFSTSNGNYRYDAKVDYYTKPVFRVEIDTGGKDYYPMLDFNFEGFVDVSYYFGQPVVGASVELTILNYMGEERKRVEGITNSEGKFNFEIKLLFISDLEYSFRVDVDVVDTFDRSASASKTYTRMEQLFAHGYLSNWAPNPNEYSEYYFYAYQYVMYESDYGWWSWNYNPLANITAKIEIYGIEGYPYYRSAITNEVLLQTYFAETNNFGSGKLEYKLPLNQISLYDLFEIRLTVKLEDSRTTTSSYYYRYKKYSLDINIVDSTINTGEVLEFDVTFKNTLTDLPSEGEGRIYLYDSKHQLVGRANEEISGTKRYSLTIPSFYPEGIYYIYSSVYSGANEYYGGFSYHSAHESFKVGSYETISFETNFTNTGNYYDQIIVQKDSIINITGTSNVSTNLPLFIEIYKRGILYSVPLEVFDDQFSFLLPIIAEYAPDFTIIVYTISEEGKLFENILAVHVEYSYNFDLSTDKEIYEPGDTVTLTITPSENQTSMFSISFIDSSVLDVEPEDDSELAYFTMNTYYTYISSGSSWGSGFDYRSYWWYWCGTPSGGIYNLYYPYLEYDRAFYAFGFEPTGGFEGSPPSFENLLTEFDTDIRSNISESANWIPKLIISEPTEFSFKLPDNIGEWTIRVVGNSLSEAPKNIVLSGTVKTIRIKSFLPFFVEFELPQPISQDDILSVKAYVYNYIGTDVLAYVAIDAPNLVVLNKEVQILTIPKGFVSEVEFSVYCKEPYYQNITILAATDVYGTPYSDAKLLTTYIKPNGIEVINRTIGFLNVSDSPLLLDYNLDPLAIYHEETLSLYTDLMDISIDSWQSLIGYPYGCIEQTISKLLPSALMFDYLNQTGQLTSRLEKEISLMVLEGISRIYNFQHTDGGWGWWRDDGSKVIMTSIVVSALNQVEESGFHVNPTVIQNGINYLIDQQRFNGEWDFQDYSSNTLEATAYVLKAIMKYYNITTEIETSINKAVDRFNILWYTGGMKSSYAASLFYIATVGSTYQNTSLNNVLIQYLKNNKQIEDDTVYWDSDQDNPWYWRKLGNEVEITSYATLALASDDYIDNYAIIQKAVRYLLNQRNRWGWRTTADTAAAISVLTQIKQIATSKGFINFNGSISVSVNTVYPPQYVLNVTEDSNLPSEIQLSLSDLVNQGSNNINITLNGMGQICYIFESVQILRSNPKVEIPDLIEVSASEQFNLTVGFSDIDNRMPILYATLNLIDVPEDLQDPVEDYSKFIPIITNGSEVSFSLITSDVSFQEYILKGVKVTGFIRYTNSDDSSSYQLFHRTVGPLTVRVGTEPIISKASKSYAWIEGLQNSGINDSETLTLTKQVSKTSSLLPGDVITATLTITNNEGPKQFYVLEDGIPTGTTFLSNSVTISGGSSSEITYDLYQTGIHFFFPILPNGTTEITYQVQVNSIKNSYSGQCKLWGMYDDLCVSSQSVTLENIPLRYYANHSIYRDLITPSFSNVSIKQIEQSSSIKIMVQLRTSDNTGISKIRVIFAQNSGWRVRTLYATPNQEMFSLTLTGFSDVESDVAIFVEVYDIYGNIATSPLRRIDIVELIPYLVIGAIVGFAIGLASLFSFLSKRATDKKHIIQDEKFKKTQRKLSFLESTDDPQEETVDK